MKPIAQRILLAFVVAAVPALAAHPARAQDVSAAPYKQVVSANPFGLLLDFFNAEYERVATETSTVGTGGSTFKRDSTRYVNADVFWRFYPSGNPLDGWAFGAKVGLTSITDEGTYFGYGFDVNRSWLLGSKKNFYVGAGLGLKRLAGGPEEGGLDYIPTIRLVNVGIAF